MPLDGKDTSSTWSGPPTYKSVPIQPDAPWEPDDNLDTSAKQEQAYTSVPANKNSVHLPPNDEVDAEDTESDSTSSSTRSVLMNQLGRYSSFVLAPLILAGLTSLIVLPIVGTGHAKLPPQTLFPLAIIIVAIALAQGIATYYSDTTTGLWTIYTLLGFFLFMLVGCFALFGLVPGIIVLLIFTALSLFLLRRYGRSVNENQVYIVQSMGKYKRTLYAGFNILLPWEQISAPLNTAETLWKSPLQRIQMTRDEDVILRGNLSYQLLPEDAYLVASVKNWEESLHNIFISSMQSVARTFAPDDFIVWPEQSYSHATHGSTMSLSENEPRWEQVNGYLLQSVRDRAALWGVQVNEVHLYDISLVPHERATQSSTAQPSQPFQPAQPVSQTIRKNSGAAPRQQPVAQPKLAEPKNASQPIGAQPQIPKPSMPQQPLTTPSMPGPQVPKGLKEDTLRKAYTEVKNGNIREPETIRNLAAQFEAVANDPELSESFSFDAGRAAMNLYAEADRRQEEEEASIGTLFSDETKVDWPKRRATDENIMSGG